MAATLSAFVSKPGTFVFLESDSSYKQKLQLKGINAAPIKQICQSNIRAEEGIRFDIPSNQGYRKRLSVRAKAAEGTSPTKRKSIVCGDCEGNGVVLCSQCKGSGINSVDHFNGQFKAGATCWLCRGKREMLCGNCNGAGFMGGFMSTQDE